MAKGSYVAGLGGMIGGILVALLAITIGASSVLLFGGEHHTPNAVHENH